MKPRGMVLLALLSACGCISLNQFARPGGETAAVVFRTGSSASAELLAVDDVNLYCVEADHVVRIPVADISRVRVDSRPARSWGVSGRTWRNASLIAAGVVGVVFAIDAFMHVRETFILAPLLTVPPGLLIGLQPEPPLSFTLDPWERNQLVLYCRYPQGLTEAQWQELLAAYGQTGFWTFETNR
jgi:hypothetical protein